MDPTSNAFPVPPAPQDADTATELTSRPSFHQDERPAAGNNVVQGVTGPVGEPGLPPPRPVSLGQAADAQDAAAANTSRAGILSSRMHAPSLASRAFFAPMGAQRLQAYRGHRPVSNVVRRASMDSLASQKMSRRSSFASGTMRGGTVRGSQDDISIGRPASRGSEYTDWTGHAQFDGAPVASGRNPAARHQVKTSSERPPPIDPEKLKQHQTQPRNGNSPHTSSTFMSNFRRTSRQSFQIPWQMSGQEKLASSDSTPTKQQSLEEQRQAKKPDLGKNYEYFTGNTAFFWGGRLQTTRDKPIAIFTGACVVIPCILFFVFSAPFLWHHVSAAVPIFFALFFYITFSSYLHAALSNPGIYPRNLHPQPPNQPMADPYMDSEHPTSEWILVKSDVAVYGAYEVPVKYCKSCNIWRPPRCHHCRVCDSCIDTQDHHCMWLNNCVGRRNYRYFFTFVSSGAFLGVYLLGASIGHIAKWQEVKNAEPGPHPQYTFADAIDHNRVPMAMFIYGILAFLYPGALTVYHIILMVRGQTTREYINSNKFNKEDRHRPFNHNSWWKNIVVVLCRPRPPTYLHFKRRYEEGDQRFGPRRGHRIAPLAPQQQGGGGMEMQQFDPEPGVPFQGPTARGPIVNRTPREGEFGTPSEV